LFEKFSAAAQKRDQLHYHQKRRPPAGPTEKRGQKTMRSETWKRASRGEKGTSYVEKRTEAIKRGQKKGPESLTCRRKETYQN